MTELDRQLAVGWLDLVQFVLPLAAYSVLEPGCFVVFVVSGGSWAAVSDGLEALVEKMSILVILGRLLRDLGECARLRNGDQLSIGDDIRAGINKAHEDKTLTRLFQRRYALGSLAGGEAPQGQVEAHCECCWQCHSWVGIGPREDVKRPTATRGYVSGFLITEAHTGRLTSISEVLCPPKHDAQTPIAM